MKHSKKTPLWYNPAEKESRREDAFHLSSMAADREGRALLESYCRMYRKKR